MCNYDGLGLADLIAKKEITPLELLCGVRQRVDARNPKLNALCHLFFDKAEAQISQGLGRGPFRGVPFALKDVGQYLAGTITSAGSRIWKDNVADFDSTLVESYKQTGLVIFGKTNSPELGLTTTTESVLFGQTHNPWNLQRSVQKSFAGIGRRLMGQAHLRPRGPRRALESNGSLLSLGCAPQRLLRRETHLTREFDRSSLNSSTLRKCVLDCPYFLQSMALSG